MEAVKDARHKVILYQNHNEKRLRYPDLFISATPSIDSPLYWDIDVGKLKELLTALNVDKAISNVSREKAPFTTIVECFEQFFQNNGSASFAGMATKMERYCIRFALVLEVIRYGCGESKLKEISLKSVKGAISLCYYFIASAIKAHRKFTHDPLSSLTEQQRSIYNELPITFETGEGVEIAKTHKVNERTFKDWLKSGFFRHIKHGTYEKRYK